MKRIQLYAILLSSLFMIACGSDDDGGSGSSWVSNTPQSNTQSVTLEAKAVEVMVTLSALNTAISSVSNNASWLVVTPLSFTSGSPRLLLSATENTDNTERKCEVTVTAQSGREVKLTVTQQAAAGDSSDTGTGIADLHDNATNKPAYAPKH